MTRCAGSRRNAGVAEACRLPGVGTMAGVASGGGGYVACGLAFDDAAVVTHGATAGLQSAVSKGCRRPCLAEMASIALLGGGNVISVFGRTGKPAAGLMAGVAVLGGSLEYAALMAAFAAYGGVCARQRKTGEAMVDLRSPLGNRHVANDETSRHQDRELHQQQSPPAFAGEVGQFVVQGGQSHKEFHPECV